MLVLARKVEQSILLDGGKIRISVLEVHGGRVKIGVEAPRDVVVQREDARGTISRVRELSSSKS